MTKLRYLNAVISITSFIGLGLSVYSYFIEQQEENYKAYCDISDVISCTKTFKSKYGTGFGIMGDVFGEKSVLNQPNSLLGIIFFSLSIVAAQMNNKPITILHFLFNIVTVALSVYLAYVMITKVKTICVICLTMYVVNIINMIFCQRKLSSIYTKSKEEKKRK